MKEQVKIYITYIICYFAILIGYKICGFETAVLGLLWIIAFNSYLIVFENKKERK